MTEKNKRYLVLLPFFYKNRTGFIVEKFFDTTSDFSSVLHLTSRWTRIDDFRTRLYLLKKKPLIPPCSYSLKAFAGKIVQEKTGYRLISGIEQLLILLDLCGELAAKRKMSFVSLAEKVRSFIKDFKVSHEKFEFELWMDEIEKYPWKYEENRDLVKEVMKIMQNYQNFLEEKSLVDEDDLYRIASDYIEDLNFNTVLLEGMVEFIPSQKRFIQKVSERSRLFICVYQFDENAPFDARKYILKPNFEFLKSITDSIITIDAAGKIDDCIVYNFPSPDEEIRGIGEMIVRKMNEDKKMNWEDFLVVFPQMLSYREPVQRIFTRLKIPFCMTPGYVLSQDPSVVAIISFLNWLDSPLWWESIMSLFTSPFFSFDFEEAIKFSEESRKVFKGMGFFPDKNWLRKWENWKKLEEAKSCMEAEKTSLLGWTEGLLTALEKIGWREFDAEGKIALMDVLEELKSEIRVDRQSFVKIFKSALDLTEVEKSKGYGVRVMGILDSTGLETEFAFFGGATDDALPEAATTEEFFLPDNLKEKLKLSTYNSRVARERLDIHRLKMSHDRVIFSYPSKVSGRQKGKSIMLYKIKESSYGATAYVSGTETIFSLKIDIEKFRKKFIEDGILHFSVSQLDSIARCPYDFYLTYVEGIEPYRSPEVEEIPEFWGILLHSAAEKAAANFKGRVMDKDIIRQQYDSFCRYVNRFIEEPHLVSGEFFYRIPSVMRNFLERRKESVFNSFREALDAHIGHKIVELERMMKVKVGKIVITGKFDRIEKKPDGNFEIIDLKSGKIPEIRKKFPQSDDCFELDNLELPLYALMYYKMTGIKPDVLVWSLNFDEPEFEKGFPQISGFLEAFENSLNIAAEKILDGNFRFDKKGKNCFGCRFSNYCVVKGDEGEQ